MTSFSRHLAPLLVVGGLICGGLLAMPAQAQGTSSSLSQDEVLDIVFSTVERRVIEDYFGYPAHDGDSDRGHKRKHKHKGKGKGKGGKKGLPPGLATRKSLPPGLAKRRTLPPGLAKRDLPYDLDDRLGPPPRGTERIIVDNNVLLVEAATGVVLDILQDVIRNQ